MAKLILLVTFLLGQCLAEEFQINWRQRLFPSPTNAGIIYEVPENATASSNVQTNVTSRVYTVDNTDSSQDGNTSPVDTAQPRAGGQTIEAPKEIPKIDIFKFRENMRMFAANFYSHVLKTTGDQKNILYSPISITHAMGMVNAGARGNSSDQIEKSLHFRENMPTRYINALFRNITSAKFGNSTYSEVVRTMVARSFIHDKLEVRDAFLRDIQTQYHSDVERLDFFFPEKATNRINQWVKKETNKLIEHLIPDGVITIYTRLVLVNAIYFNGPWKTKFLHARARDFTTPSGKVTVPFMSSVVRCHYKETESSEFIAIPYKDDTTYFFIILPKSSEAMKSLEEAKHIEEYFKNLNEEKFRGRQRKIEIFMPKFTVEQETDVKKILQSMGVKDIFDDTVADLTGIAQGLYVSDFLHKAKLSVDETGTEAAAATAVVVSGRTIIRQVHVNRPFLFGVIETEGDILFMGKIVNPSTK